MNRSQQGFTLVELLVAVVILSVGLLALASSSAVMMSQLGDSQSKTLAASVAETRFERIRSTACASRTSGSAVSRGISETWTRTPLARADDVTVTVQLTSQHKSQTQTFQSYLPC
jgi:type IV pilus modification protein PilV